MVNQDFGFACQVTEHRHKYLHKFVDIFYNSYNPVCLNFTGGYGSLQRNKHMIFPYFPLGDFIPQLRGDWGGVGEGYTMEGVESYTDSYFKGGDHPKP